MGDAAPLLGRGRELVADQLAFPVGVIEAEADVVPAIRARRHRSVQHHFGPDRGPLREGRLVGQRQAGLDEAGGVQRVEET